MKRWLKILFWVIVTIILLIIVDLIWIFNFNKPLFAIKEFNSDSYSSVYRGLLYDTYNCVEHSVPQIKFKGTKFNCAFISFGENNEYIKTDVDNVSIKISDISTKGATITIKDTNKTPYTYGAWYKIEKQENGEWKEVEPIIDNYGFNSMGYLVDKNNEVKFVINWEWLYGILPLGSYRILKKVNNQ